MRLLASLTVELRFGYGKLQYVDEQDRRDCQQGDQHSDSNQIRAHLLLLSLPTAGLFLLSFNYRGGVKDLARGVGLMLRAGWGFWGR